jgi:hypothetical protein
LRYFGSMKMSSPIRSWVAIVLVVMALAYTAFFLSISNPPFFDAPNHLARAVIMNSLWHDAHSPFQGMFSARQQFVPYSLADLGLILLLRLLGVQMAYPVWATLTVLVLVLGIWVYASQLLATPWAVAAAVLCSWYFATSFFLILGFFAFQWGLAAAFVALGALEALRRNEQKRFWWIALYAMACLICYAAHIAAFAILAGFAAAIGLLRVLRKEQNWISLCWELLPFVLLALYHFPLVAPPPEFPNERLVELSITGKLANFVRTMLIRQTYAVEGLIQVLWGGVLAGLTWFKLSSFFGGMFIRQTPVTDGPILVLFGGIVSGAFWFGRRARLRSHWPLAVVCGLALLLYFVLPFWWAGIAYVDARALPFVFIPLLMLSLRIFESSGPRRRQIACLIIACALLAGANLASLALFLPRQSRSVAQYREALLTIPEGHVVLPVDASPPDGGTFPLRHAGSFYAVDRHGYTPYLFSDRTGGGPFEYFLDLPSIYRPSPLWYAKKTACDWEKVAEDYDYVVITKPWRAGRLDFSRLELHYENRVATVFRVRRAIAGATP